MSSKPSIVELENFVKELCSNDELPNSVGDEDVIVLSTNSDGSRKTVWGPLLFRPSGAEVWTWHPNKPKRRHTMEPVVPGISLYSIYSKNWVKDARWQDPVIQIKTTQPSYQPGLYHTVIYVFCFDSYYDNAGVCHWVIDTVYVDMIGMENVVLPSEDKIWELSHKEATQWMEVMIEYAQSNQVEQVRRGINVLTDSSRPLKWGPPLCDHNSYSEDQFLILLQLFREAPEGSSYIVNQIEPVVGTLSKISIDKGVNDRSGLYGHACMTLVELEFIMEVKENVRKIILITRI